MEFNELVKNIAYNKIYNPFHPDFSEEKFKSDLFEIEEGTNKDFLAFILEAFFKDKSFINDLENIISENFDNFYYYLFSFINHDSYLLTNKAKGILNNLNQLNTYSISNIEKINISLENETYNCESVTDFLIDILDFGFSLFKILKEEITQSPKKLDFNSIDCNKVYSIYKEGQKLLLIKDLYERVCFEKGIIKKINEYNYQFEYFDPNFLLKHRVGEFRIKNNIMSALLILHEEKVNAITYQNFGNNYISNVSVDLEKGISIKYAKNPNDKEISNILYFYNVVEASIIHYHFHIHKEYLEFIRSISKIYTSLHYLLKKVTDLNLLNTNSNDCYNNFLYKIKGKDLYKYIEKITKETNISKIQEILNILIHENRRSFWEAPILQVGNYYYFSAYSLLQTNVLYLIDSWLELKYPKEIDKKGIWFEDLIYEEIDNAYNRNQFFSNRVHQKTFKIDNGEKEEVDLVWETKNNILLAEVKCIDFPFTHRKTNNAFQVLEKASKQIIRKEKFLVTNKNKLPLFPQGNKKILKCIITNYPFYSGLKINNIPIIDIGMFLNYIKEGKSGIIKYQNGQNSGIVKESKYYNNEDEFSNNLEQLIEDSPFLKTFEKQFQNSSHTVKFTDTISITYPDVISQ